jgi:UDP-N-acetylmuramyl tripeptide synthase
MEDQDRTCHHVPLTLGGKAKFMIANVLAATLASYVWGFKTEDISLSLQTFIPRSNTRTNEYF